MTRNLIKIEPEGGVIQLGNKSADNRHGQADRIMLFNAKSGAAVSAVLQYNDLAGVDYEEKASLDGLI